MITYSDIRQHSPESLQHYLDMPGYSHSFLKQQRFGIVPTFNMTAKVMIGKIVDAILTGDASEFFASEHYKIAREIAAAVKDKFGDIIKHFKCQQAYSATMTLGGLSMHTKGILDWCIPKLLVADLKVTHERNMAALINYMGYGNQLWNYGKLCEAKQGCIIMHSVPLKKTELFLVDVTAPSNEFWANAIMDFGRVAA